MMEEDTVVVCNIVDQFYDHNIIYKEVVVIGNGPSGILTSLMLSGYLPCLISSDHPNEMLRRRLKSLTSSNCLIKEDLEFLSQDLEGRSTNPISLLMDALIHPCADLGFELEPLVDFRCVGKEIDHILLGRGSPGGCWHRIDPDILTLSLGNWMALPIIPFPASSTSHEKRAFTKQVATYYEDYVKKMGLKEHFIDDVLVQSVTKLKDNTESISSDEGIKRTDLWQKRMNRNIIMESVIDYFVPINQELHNNNSRCFLDNAINCLFSRSQRKNSKFCRFKTRGNHHEAGSHHHASGIAKHDRKNKSIPCSSCCVVNEQVVKQTAFEENDTKIMPKWLVESRDVHTGKIVRYNCKYLILACGTYDAPNRLELFQNVFDPEWLFHDLRDLEVKLDEKSSRNEEIVDPVLIIGAGLSAADAVMAIRSRNIKVIHTFRSRSSEFTKQLPENMYPEYHKVRQMMNDDDGTYPLYTAYPEHSVTDFDAATQYVKLTSKAGDVAKVKISFVLVLIGSKPDLSFLPNDMNIGVYADKDIDCKTNPIDINPLTHEVIGQDHLFAVGPLAGDNFVRYIPGGVMAVVTELYKKLNL